MSANGQPSQPELEYRECPFGPVWEQSYYHFSMYFEPIRENPEDPEEVTAMRLRVVPTIQAPTGQVLPLPPAPQVCLYFGMDYFRTAFAAAVANEGKVPAYRGSGIVIAGPGDLPVGQG